MAATYIEQYNRMKRWYDRFVALNHGRPHNVSSDNYLDEIYAFFLNCYHLKDWIRNDGMVDTVVQQSVEPHMNSSRPLKLCADICNSLKHLRLDSSRSGESPAFGKKQFGLALGPASTTIKLKYEVNTTTGPVDAFQLATECVDAWDAFLTANKLK
jgi:hypothetical protein